MDRDGTVLIVEDDDQLASLYADWLDREWTVRVARDGGAALDALGPAVDVVLLDRELPGLSGDEVLDYLRSNDIDSRVAIVSGTPPDFDALELGFDEYVCKPVDRETLEDAVERLFARTAFTDLAQSLFAALRKREVVRREKSRSELAESDEYEELLDEIDDLRRRTESVNKLLEPGDYRALFYDLRGTPSPGETASADA